MWYLAPEVIAAAIAAIVAVVGLFLQRCLAREMRVRADESAIKVKELEKANTENALRLQYALDDLAAYRDARRNVFSRLLNAASIARSAAEGIIEESRSTRFPTQIARTAGFLQQISLFLDETAQACSSVHLDREDIDCVLGVQDSLVKLFLALDPDAGQDPNYQHKLCGCRAHLDDAVAALRTRIQAEWAPAA